MEVFVDPPKTFDPRQSKFNEAMTTVVGEMETEGYELATIHMVGFPASRVDLGWLQDRVRAYCEKGSPTKARVVALVKEELPTVIQRLKKSEVWFPEDKVLLDVEIVTKDDGGYYTYKFSVYLPEVRNE